MWCFREILPVLPVRSSSALGMTSSLVELWKFPSWQSIIGIWVFTSLEALLARPMRFQKHAWLRSSIVNLIIAILITMDGRTTALKQTRRPTLVTWAITAISTARSSCLVWQVPLILPLQALVHTFILPCLSSDYSSIHLVAYPNYTQGWMLRKSKNPMQITVSR